MDSGVREIDQASPLRKRTFEDAATGALDVLDGSPGMFLCCIKLCFPDSRTVGIFVSSHCVSQPWMAKASLATIPRRTSKLVLTPSTYVSARARFAFRTTSPHVGAVMMILASKLSKSVPTIVAGDGRR